MTHGNIIRIMCPKCKESHIGFTCPTCNYQHAQPAKIISRSEASEKFPTAYSSIALKYKDGGCEVSYWVDVNGMLHLTIDDGQEYIWTISNKWRRII